MSYGASGAPYEPWARDRQFDSDPRSVGAVLPAREDEQKHHELPPPHSNPSSFKTGSEYQMISKRILWQMLHRNRPEPARTVVGQGRECHACAGSVSSTLYGAFFVKRNAHGGCVAQAARWRSRWCLWARPLDVPFEPFRHGSPLAARAEAVKGGRCEDPASCSTLSRPSLDRFEHAATLVPVGTSRHPRP